MKIGIDIMGGDYAPESTIQGSILAYNQLPENIRIVLIGNKEIIVKICEENNFDPKNFEIINSLEMIEMGEHPSKAFSNKPNSSIAIGFNMLKTDKIQGFAGAGNTGAMMVGAIYSVRSIPGIIRPTIAAALPKENGKSTIILDVGLNPDCRPDVLYQYAILGSIYAENVYSIDNPRVGLLNIGSEEEKGNLLTKSTYELMKGTIDFNFIGNVEGNDFFNNGKVDVVICDGFVGNVIIKEAEAFYSLIKKRNKSDEYFDLFNFEHYGGTPILGINSPVVVGHGISNGEAIKNMILHTKEVVEANLCKKIKGAFNNG